MVHCFHCPLLLPACQIKSVVQFQIPIIGYGSDGHIHTMIHTACMIVMNDDMNTQLMAINVAEHVNQLWTPTTSFQ